MSAPASLFINCVLKCESIALFLGCLNNLVHTHFKKVVHGVVVVLFSSLEWKYIDYWPNISTLDQWCLAQTRATEVRQN